MMSHDNWLRFIYIMWVILTLTYFDFFTNIEGRFFPVVSEFQITKIKPVYDGIEVSGTFKKIRDCDFESIAAHLNDGKGHTTSIAVTFREKEVVRESGDHKFGPWFFNMMPSDFKNVKIHSLHKCHSLWETRTRLLPQ